MEKTGAETYTNFGGGLGRTTEARKKCKQVRKEGKKTEGRSNLCPQIFCRKGWVEGVRTAFKVFFRFQSREIQKRE